MTFLWFSCRFTSAGRSIISSARVLKGQPAGTRIPFSDSSGAVKQVTATGCRDVAVSFTVNNQEVTRWYCSHNCDCLCGQARSERVKLRSVWRHTVLQTCFFYLEHFGLLLPAWWHHLGWSWFPIKGSLCSGCSEESECVWKKRHFEVKKGAVLV